MPLTGTVSLPDGFSIREAEREDAPLLFEWILKLAEFENLSDCVTATVDGLVHAFFDRKIAHALFVETAGKSVGFAVWFYNYSTFAGKSGLFLEDIFIAEGFRGKGLATSIFAFLENRASAEGCSRLEWYVLDWNVKAAAFYQARGGKKHEGWEIYRKPLGE